MAVEFADALRHGGRKPPDDEFVRAAMNGTCRYPADNPAQAPSRGFHF